MKICLNSSILDAYFQSQLKEIEDKYENVNIIYHKGTAPLNLENIDLLITSRITEEELESANVLKAILFPYTGVNNLPLNAIKNKNITIVNSHGHAPIVALRAFSLSLALLGRVVELNNQLQKGDWLGKNGNSTWDSILNKRCGMIGMGEIGQHIVKYLKPFHTPIVTLDRYLPRCKQIDQITYYQTINKVIEHSDIIFVSLPLTKETKHIIDQKMLSRMENKYIINVGRGELINETDLYNALKNKTLKGAALDVWYQYPKKDEMTNYPSKLPFHKLDNIVLSPHCSGNASSSHTLVVNEIISNIKQYIEFNKFKNIVDVDKAY